MDFEKECKNLTEPLRHRLQMLMYFGPKIGEEDFIKRLEVELWIYQLVYKIWQEKKKDFKAMSEINLSAYHPEIASFLESNPTIGYSVEKVVNYIAVLAMEFNIDMRRLEINQKNYLSKIFLREKNTPEKEFQIFRRVCLEHLDHLATIKQPFDFHGDFKIDNQIIRKYMAC